MSTTQKTDEEQTGIDLRDKIKSKMEVAKFFSGFLSLLLGFSIGNSNIFIEKNPNAFWLVWFGIAFIFLSLVFSVATLFAYDRLLMPKKFWEGQGEYERSEFND